MSDNFNIFLSNAEKGPFKFINNNLKEKIYIVVRDFFPKLNDNDLKLLQILTTYTVDLISFKYGFIKDNIIYEKQWTQNSCRDIKGIVLLLLPYIDDGNNSYLLNKLTDLNHLLYSQNKRYIA